MLVAHYAPRLTTSGGRRTRASILTAAVGSRPVSSVEELLSRRWDVVLVDSNPLGPDRELAGVLPELKARSTRLVLLARALTNPVGVPAAYDDVVDIGPYELAGGDPIGPLVVVPERTPEPDVDVLMVVGSADPRWWARQAERIAGSGRALTVLSRGPMRGYDGHLVRGSGSDWIGRARVVVGGGGVGTLYETLWSGGRLVAHPFNGEQESRIGAARGAGEAITRVWALEETLPAIERVEAMTPLEPRPAGVDELRARLEAPWR